MDIRCEKCSDATKEINGCETDSTMGERWVIGDYKFKRCPVKIFTQEGLEYLEAYRFYKQNILPMYGGWLDQTQTFVEAIKIIDAEVGKIQKEIQKKN